MSSIPAPPTPASLPSPVPQRAGSQANFTSAGNNFVAALPQLISDLSAAMQWIKDAADAVQALADTESGELQQVVTQFESARDQALSNLQTVLDQIEDVSAEVGDIQTQIDELTAGMLEQIEEAKQQALLDIEAKCGSESGGGA